jgi:hypothetical protein
MSIRSEIETETTEEICIESFAIDNHMRLLLSRRNNPVQRVEDLERMMAEFDPNRS